MAGEESPRFAVPWGGCGFCFARKLKKRQMQRIAYP